jgi:hypothetical protein
MPSATSHVRVSKFKTRPLEEANLVAQVHWFVSYMAMYWAALIVVEIPSISTAPSATHAHFIFFASNLTICAEILIVSSKTEAIDSTATEASLDKV